MYIPFYLQYSPVCQEEGFQSVLEVFTDLEITNET